MTPRPPFTSLPSVSPPRLHAPLWRGLLAAFACLPGLLHPAVSNGQAFNLGVRVDLPMGTYPASVAVADMNGDGTPDLVSTNSQDSNLSIQLGLGGGAYAPRVNFATGGNPLFLVVADFNRDGRPDVATSNFDSGNLSILLGNGAGGLGPKVDIVAEFRPRMIVVADMNGDNLLDLVVPNYGAGNLSVFLGNGSGGFAPRTNYSSFNNPTCATTPDLNGDGRPDLVVTNFGSTTISVLLANGSGGFGAKTDYTVGSGSSTPHWVTNGDLNNDGFDDVAVADYGTNQFSILLGNGTGSLGPKTDFATGTGPISIALADMNADGFADMVTALASGSVSVNAGNGSGGFGSATTVAVGSGPYQATVADLNGDGRLDIVVPNQTGNSLSLLFGNGPGGFAPAVEYGLGSVNAYDLKIADMTRDGNRDVVCANFWSSSMSLLRGDGHGELASQIDNLTGTTPQRVAIGDLNVDGNLDAVIINDPDATLSVLLGNGGGVFTKTNITLPKRAFALDVGDVNHDGKLDIVTANGGANSVSTLLGNGLGGFGGPIESAAGSFVNDVAIADMDHTLWTDVVVVNGLGLVSIVHGAGGGGFNSITSFPCGSSPNWVSIADLNGDGYADVAVNNYGATSASVLMNNGAGSLGAPITLACGDLPNAVTMGDVNGDGRPDVVIPGSNSNILTLYYGNGAGGFGPRIDIPTGSIPWVVAIGDLTNDNRPDLAVSCRGFSRVDVHLSFARTRVTLAASPSPAVLGAPMVLSASVSVAAPGSGTPTGTVRFFDGTTLLGSAPVSGGTTAMLFTPAARLGNRTLTAVYSGDGTFFPSTSAPQTQRVFASAAAQINGIVDIPNDQGYQVRMTFNASPFDYLASPTPIANYLLYRKIDTAPLALNGPAAAAAVAVAPREAAPSAVELAGWDFLMTIPATADQVYEAVVPTLINGAGNLSTFFVRATLATPGLYYDSPQAQGYSLDNLPPGPPTPFLAAYSGGATHLHWGANLESDLAGYKIYKGSSPGFVPGPGNLVATAPDTGFADAGIAGSYYKISATDVNGNESSYTLLTPQGTLDAGNGGPPRFALEGARPNPARGNRLNLWFSLPSSDAARLELMDVSGRRVADREVGSLGAGQHLVDLAEGRTLPAGIYLVRLTQGTNTRVGRVAVVE